MRSGYVICRACNGTGRSRYRDNQCCDQCDGWGKRLAPITESGHEITNTDLVEQLRALDLARLISEDNRRHSVKA